MIEISTVNKAFGKQQALNEVSLNLGPQSCIALIGPNGSGKTTLIKAILSLVIPDSGNIKVSGDNVSQSESYREKIGYMPQMSRLPENMTVSNLFSMIKMGRETVKQYDLELYKAFGIEDMQTKLLGALSGGMRQKVSAALAFLFDPDILILDEPTSALDPVANEALKEKIKSCKESGKLIIITSHNLNELDGLIDRVIYLMEGRVHFDSTMAELKLNTQKERLNQMIVHMLKNQEL